MKRDTSIHGWYDWKSSQLVLDPRLDPLRARQCFADVEQRIYPPD